MAIKHFKQYLNTVTAQYNEMQANLRQFEEECQEGLVEPERVTAVVQMIAPIKANWEQLMYIDYLFHLFVQTFYALRSVPLHLELLLLLLRLL